MFAPLSLEIILCVSRGHSTKEKNASIRAQNNGSVELKVETGTWSLWAPHASESLGKEGSYYIGRSNWSYYQREIGLPLQNRGKEYYVWNTGDSSGAF